MMYLLVKLMSARWLQWPRNLDQEVEDLLPKWEQVDRELQILMQNADAKEEAEATARRVPEEAAAEAAQLNLSGRDTSDS